MLKRRLGEPRSTLAAEGLRGHVYIDNSAIVRFATNVHGHRKVLGEELVLDAFAKTAGSRRGAEEFLDSLSQELRTDGIKTPITPRTWWDTPHLVVTGTPPAVALGAAAACIHEIAPEGLKWLTLISRTCSTIGVSFDDITRIVTGRPAHSAALKHAAQTLGETLKPGEPGWTERWIRLARGSLLEKNDLRSILKRQPGPGIRWPLGQPATCGALEADLSTVEAPDEDHGRLWIQRATSKHPARLILLDADDSEVETEVPDTTELASELLSADRRRRETPCNADEPWTQASRPGWSNIVDLAEYMAGEAASKYERRTLETTKVIAGRLCLSAENAPDNLLGTFAAAWALSAETCEKCGAKGDPVADSRGQRTGCRCSGCRAGETAVLERDWPARSGTIGDNAYKDSDRRLENQKRYSYMTRLMRGDEDTGRGMWGWTHHTGWGGLIRALLITLRTEQDEKPDNPKHYPFRFGTVKEKWGTLRVEEHQKKPVPERRDHVHRDDEPVHVHQLRRARNNAARPARAAGMRHVLERRQRRRARPTRQLNRQPGGRQRERFQGNRDRTLELRQPLRAQHHRRQEPEVNTARGQLPFQP